MPLREQMQKLVVATRLNLQSQDESEITSTLDTIDGTLTATEEKVDDVDVVPQQARNLLNVLSKSGIQEDKRNELANMARNVWEG